MRRKPSNWRLLSRYTWFIPGIGESIILLLFLLLGAAVGSLITLAFTAMMGAEAGNEYSMLLSYPVMFIPAMIYAAGKSSRMSMDHKGLLLDNTKHFSPLGAVLCAVLAIVSTLAMSFVADASGSILPAMPEWLQEALESMTKGELWVDLLCVSIFAPFFEEWLCRGTVLRGLLGKGMKPAWAIIISAAFFAIIHANPWQAVPAFLLGCLFGYVYWKTGSLKLTMLMHCTNNTFAVILSNIDALSEMETWRDLITGPEYWVILIACVMITALSVLAFNKIPVQDEGYNCDSVPSIFEQE